MIYLAVVIYLLTLFVVAVQLTGIFNPHSNARNLMVSQACRGPGPFWRFLLVIIVVATVDLLGFPLLTTALLVCLGTIAVIDFIGYAQHRRIES